MQQIVESVIAYAEQKGIQKGWICTDGRGFFLKAADNQSAQGASLRYIFFINNGEVTIYQS